MSSINDQIVLPFNHIKEALYISPITGGITKIQIKEFRASFPIRTIKSELGDFYPITFNIYIESTTGHEYKLEELVLIDPNPERCKRWAGLSEHIIEFQENKNRIKNGIINGKYADTIKEMKAEKEYKELLNSGMFFEFYPALSGDYEKDKEEWMVIYENLIKLRQGALDNFNGKGEL